jgi:hypothetical protein
MALDLYEHRDRVFEDIRGSLDRAVRGEW